MPGTASLIEGKRNSWYKRRKIHFRNRQKAAGRLTGWQNSDRISAHY